jgi:hypothetical protein
MEHRGETIVGALVAVAAMITVICGAFVLKAATASANQCMPIHLSVRALPREFVADVGGAAARVTAASGIPFVIDTAPQHDNDVVHVVASPSERLLDGRPLAAVTATPLDGPSGITLYSARLREHGLDRRNQWGGVLMHEFAHVVGLTHSGNVNDVMYSVASTRPAVWSAHDTDRLAGAGAARGCAPATSSRRS